MGCDPFRLGNGWRMWPKDRHWLEQADEPETSQRPDVDVVQLLSNGYVMAVVVFLSCFFQGVLSQASNHVLSTEGIRLRTALQSCKSLTQ